MDDAWCGTTMVTATAMAVMAVMVWHDNGTASAQLSEKGDNRAQAKAVLMNESVRGTPRVSL
ncbi:RNA-binding protein [Actinidia virus C]|nr:RNA-binding protein [Actinidia virus C]QJD14815.1 RNA-binding protein [Actinidia virus C]